MIHFFSLAGVAVFAVSGVLAAGRKHMDIFGAIVLALTTGLGGGTVRDIVLDEPIFWVEKPSYVFVGVAVAIVAFFYIRTRNIPDRALSVADAFGLALFTMSGTAKAFAVGENAGIAIIMGLSTGVVGGMIRDMLCGEIPLILRSEIYATASLAGAGSYALIHAWSSHEAIAKGVCVAVTLGIRLAAIYRHITLPPALQRTYHREE